MTETKIRRLRGVSNLEFLRRYGKPGTVALFGGSSAIDRGIRVAQRELDDAKRPSLWSHAAVLQGERIDGRHWLVESDFDVGQGSLRNGVQENRIEKYEDEKAWPNLAVLDFDLSKDDARKVLVAGLDLVSRRTRYALGGILETYWAMMRKTLEKGREKDSTFCSAFVRAVYRHAGIDLAPGIAVQHTMPEQVARTAVPHTRYLLIRDEA